MAPSPSPTVRKNHVPFDDPNIENNWLPTKPSMIIGIVTLLLHIYFLFYIEDKYLENYQHQNDTIIVKDYIAKVIPLFLLSGFLEFIFYWWTKPNASVFRLNDSVSSVTLGSLNQLSKKLIGQVSGTISLKEISISLFIQFIGLIVFSGCFCSCTI